MNWKEEWTNVELNKSTNTIMYTFISIIAIPIDDRPGCISGWLSIPRSGLLCINF
jgi:hypothetical protein